VRAADRFVPADESSAGARRARLRALAFLFFKLGTIAFGGPAAHIAMMEDEVVRRRGWMSRQRFLDMLGATNLIPGPNSTEMAIHVGYHRAGFAGLLVAGSCFILPATFIVASLAWAYVRFGRLPAAAGLLYGVKPVVIAIIVQAVWRLGVSAVKNGRLAAAFVAAATAILLGVHELIVLFGAGALAMLFARPLVPKDPAPEVPRTTAGALTLLAGSLGTVAAPAAVPVALGPLFLIFLKIGSVLFGSGYVLLAFLRSDLVVRTHWLTESQLLDATAAGQVTPGPVFTTATFIGYLLAGPRGAAVATLGIFLPAFVFVAISAPLLPRLRRSRKVGAFLDGLNVASLALMAVVCWQLGRSAVTDWRTAALAASSGVLLLAFRMNPSWLIAAGAVIGLLLGLLRAT
jgi:chromate transporter